MYAKLEIWKNICLLCLIEEDYEASIGHKLYKCQKYKTKYKYYVEETIQYTKKYIRKNQLFQRGSCYFQCYLSPKACYNRNIKLVDCEYQEILLELSMLIFFLHSGRRILIQLPSLANIESNILTNPNKYIEYICQSIVWNNSDNIRMLKIFLEIQIKSLEGIINK